jgi:PhzF family phenazine biosynthesis protein
MFKKNSDYIETIKLYQVDAFTDRLFSGNPAAVCILNEWLSDELMQFIGNENNLSETVFVVPVGRDFEIRWFTPTVEVDLCGHATLAAAYVLFNELDYPDTVIKFCSPRSGLLFVEKKDDMLFLDFPTDEPNKVLSKDEHIAIQNCIGTNCVEVYKAKTGYIAIVDNENTVQNLQPDFDKISKLKAEGLIVTAKGNNADFVSRFFAPQLGINEDPVTGSTHTALLPLWSKKIGKTKMLAKQLSARGGQLSCELKNDRCLIGGKAQLYLRGEIVIIRN